MTAVAFALVAAVATLARAAVTANQPHGRIPWRTLGINLFGAFALGLIIEAGWFDNPIIAGTAALGSLTTFSTVAAETSALADHGRRDLGALYVTISLAGGVALAWLGLALA